MIAVGVGCRASAGIADLSEAVAVALAEAGLTRARVGVLATLDRRAGSPALRLLASSSGWDLRGFSAAELAGITVPSPSAAVADAVGTSAVAEAAALLAAGPGSVLILKKRIVGPATVAIACHFSV
ncbi:cobalamin biosynthesis protein [Actinoplanes sp. NPDC023714]|uniref:cobalamin biosynthesis protein n=1 Tax=Actinoplanes sp. NPDC023714 TaxID=3154322 RepID=UPI0033C65158